MKKVWFLFLSLAFMTLVACGTKDKDAESSEKKDEKREEVKKDEEKSSNENSTTVEYDESKKETSRLIKKTPAIDSTIDFVHSDDVLLEQNINSTFSYEAYGIKNEKEAKEKVKSYGFEEKYKGQEGVEYIIEYGKDSYTEISNIDFTKADLGVVTNIPNDPNLTDERYVSYAMSVSHFKRDGYYLEGKKEIDVFRSEREGYLYEISILHDGNKILKQTSYNEETYESLGVKDKAAAEEYFKESKAHYDEMNKLDGVQIDMQFLDDRFKTIGELDFEKMTDVKKVVSMLNNGKELDEDDTTHELAQNYSVLASQLLESGMEYVETRNAE